MEVDKQDISANAPAPTLSYSFRFASSEEIRSWSFGEVKSPETLNYRTFKPEKGGLFCERIFGPTRDWECSCGKYKRIRHKGTICDRCGVEVTLSRLRRERMGHIELAAPVAHAWCYTGSDSILSLLLDIPRPELDLLLTYDAALVPPSTVLRRMVASRTMRVITLEDAAQLEHLSGGSITCLSGAFALYQALSGLDLSDLLLKIRAALMAEGNKMSFHHLQKRKATVEALLRSKTRATDLMLTVLPVLPPDLRKR